jgi:hypothetical protein
MKKLLNLFISNLLIGLLIFSGCQSGKDLDVAKANFQRFIETAENKDYERMPNAPVIDMHLHVYSPQNYWGGSDVKFRDTVLYSPKKQVEHIEEIVNIMHAGLPIFADEIFGILFMFPNVYADISCLSWLCDYTKETLNDFLNKAVRYGFCDRIMFGSDAMVWPGAIGLSVDYIKNLEYLTEKQKRDILYNNAAKFIGLTKDENDVPF